MFPSELKKFESAETSASAFSIAMMRPDEDTIPLWTSEQVEAMLAAAPSADLTELRALPAKWLREIEEDAPPEFTPEAVEIVRAWVRCATRELEALIERLDNQNTES